MSDTMNTLEVLPGSVTLEDFKAVADGAEVRLHPDVEKRVRASRAVVERIVREDLVVYGINTGFGALKDRRVSHADLETLQENLVMSHAVGLGDPLPGFLVRGMMLLRLASLSLGYSGVRMEVLRALVDLLNERIHPCVPQDGSVGASGDLAPLAHVALALIGRGEVETDEGILPTAPALENAGLSPLRLSAKEGLALTNGTQLMTAYAAHLTLQQERLFQMADLIAAMSIEAGIGTHAACDPRIHAVRPHEGQKTSAANIFRLLDPSGILAAHEDCSKVQDQYSFRCTPQVHGAARQGLLEKRPAVLTEMNAATDNPLVFPDGDVLSGGNFHGGTIARILGEFGPMIASLGAISEKRTSYLLDPKADNGLPGFLVADEKSSGFMLPQYVAAAYVAENGKLLTPVANVTGMSTSAQQEDHVSMGPVDGKHALAILENVNRILGIEYLCAAQALDLQARRLRADPAPATARARDLLREAGAPFLEKDEELKPLLDCAVDLVASGRLLERVEAGGVELD